MANLSEDTEPTHTGSVCGLQEFRGLGLRASGALLLLCLLSSPRLGCFRMSELGGQVFCELVALPAG